MAFSYLQRLVNVDLASQAAPTLHVALRTAVPTLLLVTMVGAASSYLGLNVNVLLRDPASLGHLPPYYGVLSNLGVLGWWAAAVTCLFAGLCATANPARTFLLGSAALSAMLCFDDLFLLHEDVFYHGLGVPQKLTYAVYIALMAGHLVRFRSYILAGNWGPLVLALGMFAISVGADVLLSRREIPLVNLYEDAAKLVGISLWVGYFWNEGRRALPHGIG